jgi:lipid-binding SYLF domain-containing protein
MSRVRAVSGGIGVAGITAVQAANRKRICGAMAILAALFLAGPAPRVVAADIDDAQAVVEKARLTFGEFLRDENYGWMRDHVKDAKGILIYPQVLKGGFIFGASGGTGVLLAREDKEGNFSEPAFYTMGSVSFGLQVGGESAEVVLLVMSQKGIDSLLTSQFRLGGDVSIALGPVGGGAKGDITADFISFAKSKGLYAGLNLDGSYLSVRDSLNRAYYGKDATPADIIVRRTVHNKDADRLREELRKAAK